MTVLTRGPRFDIQRSRNLNHNLTVKQHHTRHEDVRMEWNLLGFDTNVSLRAEIALCGQFYCGEFMAAPRMRPKSGRA